MPSFFLFFCVLFFSSQAQVDPSLENLNQDVGDYGDSMIPSGVGSFALTVDPKKIVLASLASGALPNDLPGSSLLEVAQELLNQARNPNCGRPRKAQLQQLIEDRSKKCDQTLFKGSNKTECVQVERDIVENFSQACTTPVECRIAWATMLELIPSQSDRTNETDAWKNIAGERKRKRNCLRKKSCIGEQKLLERQEQAEKTVGRVRKLRRKLLKLLRTLEQCPGAGFRYCRDQRSDLRTIRRQLVISYPPVFEFLRRVKCQNKVCHNFIDKKQKSFTEDDTHNLRALETLPTFAVDPAFGGPVVAFFSVLLAGCILTISLGAYWKVLWIFKKYVAAVVLIAICCCLAICSFSIGMIGVPEAKLSVHGSIEAFGTRLGLYSVLAATILFCSALVGGILSDIFNQKRASKIIRVAGLVAILVFGIVVVIMLALRTVALTNNKASFAPFFKDFNGVDGEDFTTFLLSVSLCLTTLTMASFALFLFLHTRKIDKKLSAKTGWFLLLASLMVVGASLKCAIVFYGKFGEYTLQGWVRAVFGTLIPDILIMAPLLVMVLSMFHSASEKPRVQQSTEDEQPLLLHNDQNIQDNEAIPAQYDV